MSRRRSSARISDESAVYVARSPVSSSKQNSNLTGNARIARDLITDVCNSINLWNEKVTEGSQYVNVIERIKNDSGGKTKDLISHTGPYLKHLSDVCSLLETIMKKIEASKSSLIALQKLEEFQNRTKPLFLTWPIAKFVDVVLEICTMFQNELKFKLKIKEELYFCEDPKLLLFYSIAWPQQPYIENSCEFNLKAMEKEIGLT